jgi:hypothetical protein
MKLSRTPRISRAPRSLRVLLAAGLLSAFPVMLEAVPQPITYSMLGGSDPLKANLDACFLNRHKVYSTTYNSCVSTRDVCQIGCDFVCGGCEVPCFFEPSGSTCLDCLVACNSCRADCDNAFNTCASNAFSGFHDGHRSCVNTGTVLALFPNGNVGTPWFCGAPRSSVWQFGTLDYPYADSNGFRLAMERRNLAQPITVYLASGTHFVDPSAPLVIDHPTGCWLVNNTPANGPVLISR